jgi:hypothetical protein
VAARAVAAEWASPSPARLVLAMLARLALLARVARLARR